MKILKFTCWIIGILLILSGVFPFFYGVYRIGSLVLFAAGTVLIAFPYLLQITNNIKWLNNTIKFIYLLAFLTFMLLFTVMIKQAYFSNPPATGKLTVITLGAKVNGNQPSLMLRNRLRVTKAYLDKNQDATAIMTGGQGDDEDFPEGLIMSKYLIGLGIDPNRIIIEDKSTNTLENLTFAKELIPIDSEGIVIVSDDFHQQRASMLAKSIGIEDNYSLSSRAPYGLIPTYWARDMGGVLYTWLTEIFNLSL